MKGQTVHDPQACVFDIQRFSVHDGPGIRTTVFFKGCPLRCAWCQNPESQAPDPQLLLYEDLCLGCGACAEACPELHRQGGRGIPMPHAGDGPGSLLRPVTCTVCGRCVDVCPTGARRIAGRQMRIDEVVKAVLRDRAFYGAQGGVTMGGGEPLSQWEYVRALADQLRHEGVHVALDTACVAPREVVAAVPDHIDLVLADVKLVAPGKHRHWTGVDNADILEAIRFWSRAMPGRLWISVPLIPGVQDDDEIERIAEFCLSLGGRGLSAKAPSINHPPIRLLPYHRLGESKYLALGWPVPRFPDAVALLMETAKAIFRGKGLPIVGQ